jgi:hypothetical protein
VHVKQLCVQHALSLPQQRLHALSHFTTPLPAPLSSQQHAADACVHPAQYKHYKACLELFKLKPSNDSREFIDLISFVAQVGPAAGRLGTSRATHSSISNSSWHGPNADLKARKATAMGELLGSIWQGPKADLGRRTAPATGTLLGSS